MAVFISWLSQSCQKFEISFSRQRWRSNHQILPDWNQIGQIWSFLMICFHYIMTYDIWSSKSPDLSHLVSIWCFSRINFYAADESFLPFFVLNIATPFVCPDDMIEQIVDIDSKEHSTKINNKQIVRVTKNDFVEKIRFEGQDSSTPVGVLRLKEKTVSPSFLLCWNIDNQLAFCLTHDPFLLLVISAKWI